MARLIQAWIGPLVERELEDVVAWKTVVKTEPGAPEVQRTDRFFDNGSNYQSVVTGLESSSELQILHAFDTGSKANHFIVSDGETRVNATLATAAWLTYEKVLEEGEVPSKGDILICREITIISTPLGPPDERIRVCVEDLEFQGVNFRKTIGNPQAIKDRPRIQGLIEKITRLRATQDKVLDQDDEDMPGANLVNGEGSLDIHSQESVNSSRSQTSPAIDSRGIHVESHVHVASPSSIPMSQKLHAENVRKRKRQTLQASDVEYGSGVNNSGPQAPTMGSGSNDRTGEERRKNLNDLLGVNPQPAPRKMTKYVDVDTTQQAARAPAPVTSVATQVIAELPYARVRPSPRTSGAAFTSATGVTQPAQKVTETVDLTKDTAMQPIHSTPSISLQAPRTVKTQPTNSRGQVALRSKRAQEQIRYGVNDAPPQPPTFSTQRAPVHATRQPAVTTKSQHSDHVQATVPVSAQIPQVDMVMETPAKHKGSSSRTTSATADKPGRTESQLPGSFSVPSSRMSARLLRRHVITNDQKELLDRKLSWLPPPPGQQFPHPNVPIGILQSWNRKCTAAAKLPSQAPLPVQVSSDRSRAANGFSSSDAALGAESLSNADAMSVSSDDTPLPWEESPSQRPKLPLDSSARSPEKTNQRKAAQDVPSSAPWSEPTSSASVRLSATPAGAARALPADGTPIHGSDRSGSRRSSSPNHQDARGSAGKVESYPSPSRASIQSSGIPTGPRNSQHHFRHQYSSSRDFERTERYDSTDARPPHQNPLPQISPARSQGSLFMYANARINDQGADRPVSRGSLNQAGSPLGPLQCHENDSVPVAASRSSSGNIPTGPQNSQVNQDRRGARPRQPDKDDRFRTRRDSYRPTTDREPMRPNYDPPIQRTQQPPDSSGEIEISVPRALDTSNSYKDKRSAYYRDATRRQWVKKNVSVEDLPDLDWPALLQQYFASHPQDPATVDNLLKAVRAVYPEAVDLVSPGSARCAHEVESTRNRAKDAPSPQQISLELRKLVAETDIDGDSKVDAVLSSRHSEQQGFGKPAVESQGRRSSGLFTEFASAWKNLNAGGAVFYKMEPRPQQIQRKVSPRRLSVLNWGFGV